MAKVAIVMGSDSDMPIMKKAAEFLDQMGIDFEMTIISAHTASRMYFLNMQRVRRKKDLK